MESSLSYASSGEASSTDPIADAIALLRPRTVIDPALRAGGTWALRFEAFSHVKIGGVVRGESWLTLDGHEPVLLREGDFYLLADTPSYVLSSRATPQAVPAQPLWDAAVDGVARIGHEAEEDTYLCGGYFSFDEPNAPMLLDVLPHLVHVRAGDPRNRLLSSLTDLLSAEIESRSVGRDLVLDHLVQILFVQVLRAHAEQTDRPAGWLGALNDGGIGVALRAMHADVAHRWTLQELAGLSHMSRSAFAASFKDQVGTTPVEYLIQWRMSLARDALRRDRRSISELALAIGYESESAFSTAFRRVVGTSPRQFRDSAHQFRPHRQSSSDPRRG
ncbi:AraC family transcriptional regulator [Kineosporia sp. J2-2]|uniref:AraC family transcriptional regulator n=1 Tax=Kineosporia corallincola TaxID=2835133 RepID=A0ABS5TSB8_9ACTN|nr:AraC family transcriptional regulator [Kineosporia corallincola]MBT0773680.1 AraC family transcriptional regulator [Kineosporia corallincola]